MRDERIGYDSYGARVRILSSPLVLRGGQELVIRGGEQLVIGDGDHLVLGEGASLSF